MVTGLQVLAGVIGVLGFCLGCINLFVTLSNRSDARALSFAQKKNEVLGMLLLGEVTHLEQQRELLKLRDEAAREGAQVIADRANELLVLEEEYIAKLSELHRGMEEISANGQNHDALLYLADKVEPRARAMTDAAKFAALTKRFLEPAREYLDRVREAKKLGIDPRTVAGFEVFSGKVPPLEGQGSIKGPSKPFHGSKRGRR